MLTHWSYIFFALTHRYNACTVARNCSLNSPFITLSILMYKWCKFIFFSTRWCLIYWPRNSWHQTSFSCCEETMNSGMSKKCFPSTSKCGLCNHRLQLNQVIVPCQSLKIYFLMITFASISCTFSGKMHWDGWQRSRVNIGLGNGVVPLANKPLPEPMLVQIHVITRQHWVNSLYQPLMARWFWNMKMYFFVSYYITSALTVGCWNWNILW